MKNFILIAVALLLSTSSFGAQSVEKMTGFSLTKSSLLTFEFKGNQKPAVIMFLSKECPCSKANLDYLNELSKQFPDYSFIGVHSKKGSKNEEIINYLQDKNLSFDVLNDADLKIADEFKALKTPHVFIVSTKGEIVYNGGVTNTTFPANAKEHYLKNALTEWQKQKSINNPETRTLGCFIVR